MSETGFKCPGQDKRFWKPGDVREEKCPHCGRAIEFWKDDVRRKCPQCGNPVINPALNLACAQWCRYAEQCLEGITIEERLLVELASVVGRDSPLMRKAIVAFESAKKLLETEKADRAVVMAKVAAALFRQADQEDALDEAFQRLGLDEQVPTLALQPLTPESTGAESSVARDALVLAALVRDEETNETVPLTPTGRKLVNSAREGTLFIK